MEISDVRSPAGPLSRLASTRHSEAGSQWARGLSRPFPASSWFVCLWPRHSSLPSSRRRGHPDGVPDQPWPGICGNWAAAGGREERAAPRLAHPARRTVPGSRSWAHGAFNTMDRSHDRGALPARQPAPRTSSRYPLRGLLPGVSTRPPPDPPHKRRHRLTPNGSRVAPGTCCPGAKKILQARSKTVALALQNNPPPFPATRAPAL